MPRARSKREGGAALLVAMMVLAMMGIIGLASFDTVMRDRQVAGFQSHSRVSLYAAEAGVAAAIAQIRAQTQDLQSVASLENFVVANFPDVDNKNYLGTGANPPAFYADPDSAAGAIRYMGEGDPCWSEDPEGVMSQEEGAIQWRDALWDIRVEGESPAGSTLAIQALVTNCHPFN